ncbi:MAG: copper-binding protein [Myxococcota bacterium]
MTTPTHHRKDAPPTRGMVSARRVVIRAARAAGLSASLVVAILASAGCGSESDENSSPTSDLGPAEHTYQTRAEVVGASQEGDRRFLALRHEAIPEFVGRDGEVNGMESMVMQFEVKDGVDIDGMDEGQAIAFTFEVRYQSSVTLLLTEASLLPDGTELDL